MQPGFGNRSDSLAQLILLLSDILCQILSYFLARQIALE